MLVLPVEDAGMARTRSMYLIFMFLMFLMFSPNPPNPYRLWALEAQVEREKHAIAVLHNATYHGPFEIPTGLNLTGVSLLFALSVLIPVQCHNTRLYPANSRRTFTETCPRRKVRLLS